MKSVALKLMTPAALLVRCLSATYRVTVENEAIEQAVFARGERPIYALWHQRWFAGITYVPSRCRPVIMISRSRDGEFISGTIEKLGWRTVRGSSSRGGREAFRELRKSLDDGYSVAHIVDGPRGPFGEIKPGLIQLARMTGMPVLPSVISPESVQMFRSWDRFMIPRPFSRIVVRYEDPIYIPRRLDDETFEALRLKVERKLFAMAAAMDSRWKWWRPGIYPSGVPVRE